MQLDCGWELIWSGLIRGLLTFSNLNSVVSFSAYLFFFFYYKLLSNIGFAVRSHILDSCGLVPKWTRKEIFTIHFVRT